MAAGANSFTCFFYTEEVFKTKKGIKKVLNKLRVEFLPEESISSMKTLCDRSIDLSFRVVIETFSGAPVWIVILEANTLPYVSGYGFQSSDQLRKFMNAVLTPKARYDQCDRVHSDIENFLLGNFAHFPTVISTLDFLSSFHKPIPPKPIMTPEGAMALFAADRAKRANHYTFTSSGGFRADPAPFALVEGIHNNAILPSQSSQ